MQIDALKQAAATGDGAACFELARRHALGEEFTEARRWFAAAAAAGVGEAHYELGRLALHGLDGPRPDASRALGHFEPAIAAGHAGALFNRALIALGDRALPFDAERCAADLYTAARGGHAPAQRALGMAWLHLGDAEAAQAGLRSAVAQGDGFAAFLLARLTTDRETARGLDAFAATQGIKRAAAFADAPAPFPALAPAMLPPAPDPACFAAQAIPAQRHCERSAIDTFDGVLSALDCEYVMAAASARLQRSLVHDPHSGGPMLHPMRTSSSMTFEREDDDFWLRVLQRRLAALTGMPLAHAEPLAVLRYAKGEEYRPHRDYLRDPAELAPDAPGQRVRTVFCYLSDVGAGGATDFPLLGVRIEPRRGRVVMFDNVDAAGAPDPDTLHAGMPVIRGRKWLATLWMRERAVRAW